MLKIRGFGDYLIKGDVNWKAALAALAKTRKLTLLCPGR